MLQLKTLGGLALIRDGDVVRGPAAQRRRMAVLVLLAHAGPAGVSRDRLLAWLWPESDEPRARAALDQVLYVLRRVLGADTLVETTALHLAPGVLASDALDFEAAAAAGDDAAAVERYGGPFLDGIHFSDAPELDRWVADTRARLSTLHQAALVRLARAAEARDAWRDAAAWWRRAVETDPLAAGAAIGLVRALARADDRAAALRAAEVHAALVREELGSEPDPRVRAAADEGPASSPVGLPRPDVIPAVVPAVVRNASDGVAPEAFAGSPGSSTVPATGSVPSSVPSRRRQRAAAGALGLGGLLAALVGLGVWSRAAAAPPLEPRRVLVAPFENASADDALDPLGRMAAEWLGEGLQRAGLVPVVELRPPRAPASAPAPRQGSELRALARAYGAGLLVRGSYYRTGDSVYLHALVEEVETGRVVRSVERTAGPLARPAEAVDRVRERTMAAVASLVDPRLGEKSQEATPPPTYAAYERFVRGIDAATAYDFAGAVGHFDAAARLDTGFVLPQLWSALMLRMMERCGAVDSIGALVAPRRERLAPSDRLLLDRVLARCRGDHTAALAAMRRAADIAPGPEVLWTLAVDAVQANRPREALAALARVPPTSGYLRDFDGWYRMAAAAHHLLGEHREELAVARTGRAAHPDLASAVRTEARALAALGRADEATRVAREALRFPPHPGYEAGSVLAEVAEELAAHGAPAAARALAGEAVAWFERADSLRTSRAPAPAGAYELAGRRERAWVSAAGRLAGAPGDPWALGDVGVAAARRGDVPTARHADSLLRAPVAYALGVPSVARARIAAALNEDGRAVALLREALAAGFWYPGSLHSDPAFARLRDTPAFREVTRPRD